MNSFRHSGIRLMLCCVALLAHGCNFSTGWNTERYRDEATGAQTIVAKQRFKQDKVEISAAAKCTLPGKLVLEFAASDNFKVVGVAGKQLIPYRLGLNGHAPVLLHAAFSSPDTLVVPRHPGKDAKGDALDLGLAQQILLQLQFNSGVTTIDFRSADAGIADAFKACGADPAIMSLKSAQQPGETSEIHRPAPPVNGQPVVKAVTLATLSAQWACSGDLGDFTFSIDSYRYQFSDDSPWSAVSGRVSVGAHQAGVDGSAIFPITFEDSPWDGESTPWSYSPLGPGGTIYYISTRTGQSAQCTRA